MPNEAAKERRRKALLFRQRDVAYTTVSPQTGVSQCAGCRFFIPAGSWLAGNEPTNEPTPGCSCAIVEAYPLAILPTGYCNRYEALPTDANEPEPMAVVIVEDEPDVIVSVEDDEEVGYIAPLPVFANPLKRFFGGKNPPGVTIFRGDNGLRRAVHITSNGYKDREDEHVATKALEQYVESQFKDGAWHGDNVLDFFHEVDIGDLTAAVLVDGFLVEVSAERGDSLIAKKLWDYWETTSADGSVIWGTSHEFKAARDGDTFVAIKKKKTSVLPVEDAANLYTYSEVLNMSTAFEKHLDKALGIDGAAKILRDKGINALNAALKKRGEVAKGKHTKADGDVVEEDKADEVPAEGAAADFTALVTELLEVMANHQAELDTLKAADEEAAQATEQEAEKRKKSMDATTKALEDTRKELADLKKWRDGFVADTPRRASEDEATRLSGDDEDAAKKNIAKRTAKFDPAFGDMQVPLKEIGK